MFMDIDELRSFCLNKKAVDESLPFNEDTLVFKVGSKIFRLVSLETPFSVNLKNEPEKVIELQEEYEDIKPGYHMNKKHWITINLEGSLTSSFLKELINDSYELVVKKLTKKEKTELNF
jgi:predicted DNA-binding protein (MmcQ/YjbR family)